MCFGFRILRPLHLSTFQIPIQNLKCPKKAKNAWLSLQLSKLKLELCRLFTRSFVFKAWKVLPKCGNATPGHHSSCESCSAAKTILVAYQIYFRLWGPVKACSPLTRALEPWSLFKFVKHLLLEMMPLVRQIANYIWSNYFWFRERVQ